MKSRTLKVAGACGVLLVAAVTAACSSSSSSSSASGSATTSSGSSATAAKPYTIYLSNNFVGNDWRVQMEKEATVAGGAAAGQERVEINLMLAKESK